MGRIDCLIFKEWDILMFDQKIQKKKKKIHKICLVDFLYSGSYLKRSNSNSFKTTFIVPKEPLSRPIRVQN